MTPAIQNTARGYSAPPQHFLDPLVNAEFRPLLRIYRFRNTSDLRFAPHTVTVLPQLYTASGRLPIPILLRCDLPQLRPDCGISSVTYWVGPSSWRANTIFIKDPRRTIVRSYRCLPGTKDRRDTSGKSWSPPILASVTDGQDHDTAKRTTTTCVRVLLDT